MAKEIHILKVIESMQATVDSLSEELLTAIDREKKNTAGNCLEFVRV